ncbi:MAG: hypothetical protein KDK70_32205 [Myxococcales bacterium]|nr:hypothetical protein [Myxococcales bacterium]
MLTRPTAIDRDLITRVGQTVQTADPGQLRAIAPPSIAADRAVPGGEIVQSARREGL